MTDFKCVSLRISALVGKSDEIGLFVVAMQHVIVGTKLLTCYNVDFET